jgi:alpha-1,2-mannosyltransferase
MTFGILFRWLILAVHIVRTRYYFIGFFVLLISHGLAALYSPIQDCDEVFNYWEPTHYFRHGYGLQTWEYSPEYSIRSWLYIILHAVVAKASLFFTARKTTEFYLIRFMLAFICAACEMRLCSAIYQKGGNTGRRVAPLFLMIVAFSPGMFHASTAFLPSSFAMYASMLGVAAFLDSHGQGKAGEGIMWFGLGAILGWPFAGVLIVPLLVRKLVDALAFGDLQTILYDIANGVVKGLLILVSLYSCALQSAPVCS